MSLYVRFAFLAIQLQACFLFRLFLYLFITGKKCNLIDLQRQELERIVNLSDEALRLRVMNLHNFVFTRKQREEKKKHDEMRSKGMGRIVVSCLLYFHCWRESAGVL